MNNTSSAKGDVPDRFTGAGQEVDGAGNKFAIFGGSPLDRSSYMPYYVHQPLATLLNIRTQISFVCQHSIKAKIVIQMFFFSICLKKNRQI